MKVLLMNQFFWPDSAATSQLLTDVARDLVAQGHQVDVICGGTYAATAAEDSPAVTIHRVKGIRFSRGLLGRLSSYLTFYTGAAWRALTLEKPDVVLTLTTPPLLSLIGALMRRLRSTRFYIWEMDVYPDVAVDLGYIRAGSFLDRTIGVVADWSRRQADGIIALGDCMRARLVARGMDNARIVTINNWADSTQIRVIPRPAGNSALQIVYSGNLGLAHDLDTLTGAIQQLHKDARFSFTFIGGGARHKQLAAFIAENKIQSVTTRPYAPRADLSETLGAGDIGLVTQREDCCGSVVPSKVYGLLAAGRPILYVGPAAATPARIIETYGCGWHIANGATEALVHLLKHLADHPEEITAAGRNARKALEEHFDRPIGTGRIIALLTGENTLLQPSLTPVEAARKPVPSIY